MPVELLHPNLATDSAIAKRVQDELVPLIRHVRKDRRTLRETWLRYWRIWGATPDQESYHGRIQTYIPVARRELEAWTHRICRDLFPSDEWFSLRALRQSVEKKTPVLRALLDFYFTKHMQLRRHSKPFVRQLVTLGTSPVKVGWRTDERTLPILRELMSQEGEPIGLEWVEEKVLDYIGPTFHPVDLFSWYVWPVTVTDVDDATLIFEDLLLSDARLHALARTPVNRDDEDLGMLYVNVEELLERKRAGDQRDRVDAERRRLSDKGFTHPLDAALPSVFWPNDVTECLWKADLEEDAVTRRYLVVVGADDIPLRVQRNPFLHGRSPWLCGKFLEVENEFYGRAMLETVDKLQYFVNDIANQASDALVWSLNPVTVVDMFKVQDVDSIRMRPGAKWIAEPGGIDLIEPPKESAVTGFNALGQLVGAMREFISPAPLPVSQPGKSRGRAMQTTAGMQLMLAEAQTPIRDVVEGIEDQVFVRLLHYSHVLTQQCLDRDIVLQIAGAEGAPLVEQRISVADIVGDFDFKWLGSTTAQNQTVRAQQMINFLAMASRIPEERLQASNVTIDIGYLMRAIWTDGMQLPNGDRVVRDRVKQSSIDPRIENDLFRLGRGADVVVSEADEDDAHNRVHALVRDDPRLPDDAFMLVDKHMQTHQAAKMAKQIMRQQQEAQRRGLAYAAGQKPNGNGAGGGRMPQTAGVDDVLRSLPRIGG